MDYSIDRFYTSLSFVVSYLLCPSYLRIDSPSHSGRRAWVGYGLSRSIWSRATLMTFYINAEIAAEACADGQASRCKDDHGS
jgi:hypothetical protein